MGFIYIAWDRSKPTISKVGMTEQTPEKRISQTENPDYELYKAYEINFADVRTIEQKLHAKLSSIFVRKRHRSTSRNSEWFECQPSQAVEVISDYLLEQLTEIVNQKPNQEVKNLSVNPTKNNNTIDWLPSFDKGTREKLDNRPDSIDDLMLKRHFNRKYIMPVGDKFNICSICQERDTRQIILDEYLCSRCLYLKYPELKGKTIIL